ncbi:ATP-binding cassette domain-containing protein [Gordonia sp. LSe1-13]|uniref:ATP-binding cassette domain-containing protein n=1 Tax=Gordonia sesuvii TaxID=3116777 RepID=A0ABU7MFG0_9ACTN|nr:ATP-binding cassette domain-containing protein [Gordonia sp. LSe1-13]
MSDEVVSATGLHKSFGRGNKQVDVLSGVDLTLARGEVLALLGPNGAGKTTTVRILTTLLRPDSGSASVDGLDVVRDAHRVREIISLTGQYAAVDEKQTGRENLTMMGRLAHMSRRTIGSRVDGLLDGFDLVDAADRRVDTYSGGMRRRLDLAAGLLTRPQVLFLDEPTTGLDPRSRQTMWEVIRGVVAEGTSLFLTTQYLEEADQLADRIALIDDGRVAAEGTPAQLKRRVGDAGVEFTFGSDRDAQRASEALASFAPTVTDSAVRVPTDGTVEHARAVLAAAVDLPVGPVSWDLRAPSLDDVFLNLTGHGVRTAPADPDKEEVAA